MTHTLAQALQYANGARDLLLEQLADTKFPSTPRNDLVLAYVAIAIEHQEAIVKLVGLHLYAPAFALLRLELEAMFRGLWANLIADDSQIAAVAQEGAEPFPRFKAFAKILDESYGADGWIAGFADRWTTLNGFTHSGLEQLGRRFHDDGNVGSNYPETMIAELLTMSGTLLLGMLMPIYRRMGFHDKATALDQWLDENTQSSPVVSTRAMEEAGEC